MQVPPGGQWTHVDLDMVMFYMFTMPSTRFETHWIAFSDSVTLLSIGTQLICIA